MDSTTSTETEDVDVIILYCRYEPDHTHEFPLDWVFAGPDQCDPRGDERWRGSTYLYLDSALNQIALTQVPICDDAALDYFTAVAGWGPSYHPVYVQARRPDGRVELLDFQYDEAGDVVFPMGG